MATRQTALFKKAPTPRVKRMHVIDAGGEENGPGLTALFQCGHCGVKTDWLRIGSMTAAKRGLPCFNCNA